MSLNPGAVKQKFIQPYIKQKTKDIFLLARLFRTCWEPSWGYRLWLTTTLSCQFRLRLPTRFWADNLHRWWTETIITQKPLILPVDEKTADITRKPIVIFIFLPSVPGHNYKSGKSTINSTTQNIMGIYLINKEKTTVFWQEPIYAKIARSWTGCKKYPSGSRPYFTCYMIIE